ncbi:hypothetical protein KSP39_PZI022491 [Platanthera zijinensis]|uniref:Uncharacterized protein n=1 Tax=Platanthera zijinensis TaxID=2320716 RepID=A0AAP0AWG0_9ASPA
MSRVAATGAPTVKSAMQLVGELRREGEGGGSTSFKVLPEVPDGVSMRVALEVENEIEILSHIQNPCLLNLINYTPPSGKMVLYMISSPLANTHLVGFDGESPPLAPFHPIVDYPSRCKVGERPSRRPALVANNCSNQPILLLSFGVVQQPPISGSREEFSRGRNFIVSSRPCLLPFHLSKEHISVCAQLANRRAQPAAAHRARANPVRRRVQPAWMRPKAAREH